MDMHYLFLLISICIATLQGSAFNWFGKKHLSGIGDMLRFQTAAFCFAAILLICRGGGQQKISTFTLLTGILFGGVTALLYLFTLLAVSSGSLAFSTLIISCAMVIPTIAGGVIWKEPMKFLQWIGIALMLLSFYLSTGGKKTGNFSGKWLSYCLMALLCSGLVGILQKVHQSTMYKGELNSFLVIAFITAAVFFLISGLMAIRKSSPSFHFLSVISLFGGLAGACIALCNVINLYLSGVMISTVFFPLVNGGGILSATLAAVFFFHERPEKLQIFGIAVGVMAVILIGIA